MEEVRVQEKERGAANRARRAEDAKHVVRSAQKQNGPQQSSPHHGEQRTHQHLRETHRTPLVCDSLRIQRRFRRAAQSGRAVPSFVAAYASSALSGAQRNRQPHTSERLRRKSSRQSRAILRCSVRFQRPFGRAEQSAAAHERTPPTQIKQAEPCRPALQRTLPAPLRARRAVGSRTQAVASGENQAGRVVRSRAAAYASSALSGAQSSRQPHTR